MIYGKKYVFRWTPRLVKEIALFLLTVFTIGGIIGFAIGRISAANSETPNEPSLQETQNAPTEPFKSEYTDVHSVTSSIEESERSEPEKSYYDCPLDDDLQDYIRELCDENGIPMPLIIAMIEVESSFRADVISDTSDYGLMQINKINHEWLYEKYGITDFLDPYQNVFCGITILSQQYKRFQNVDKALMAYNLGATGAKRFWDEGIYTTSYTQKVKESLSKYE